MYHMNCFLFALPRVITFELFRDWFTFKDINRLDSSCLSLATRTQYMACISATALVLHEVRVDASKFPEYLHWLNVRSASVSGLSVPSFFLKEGSDDLVSAKNVTRLKTLNMEDCANLSDDMFQAIVKNCKYLSAVHIGSDHHLSWVTDKSLLHLSQSTTALKQFCLAQNSFVSDVGVSSVCEANRGLVEVGLRNCTEVGDGSLLAFAKFCPCLQVLKLVNNKLVKGTSLSALLHNCPNLRELVLIGCSVTLPTLDNLLLKNLSSLVLGNLPDGTALRLGQFLSHAPALKTLCLREVRSLTDEDVLTLEDDLSQLASLSMESCPRVTAHGLQALLQRCPKLQEFNVFHCNVTQDVVECLVQNCAQLQNISLTWCAGVTDAVLSPFLAQDLLPLLEQVNFNGCAQVTNITVKAFATFVPTLRSLSVCYCPKVSFEVVQEVSARHSELKIIH